MFNAVTRSFTVSRALIVIFAVLGYLLLSPVHQGESVTLLHREPWFFSIWYQWDSNWYMSIAQYGYHWVAGDQSNVAFFPLYPVSMKALGFLLGKRYLIAGLMISAISLYAAMFLLFRLIRDDFGEDIARRATWLMSIFPTAFFFTAPYTESLFLLLSVACFYYARKGRWATSGYLGFFAAMTRISGLLLIIPLLYELMAQQSFSPLKRMRRQTLWLLLIPAGLAVYMTFLYIGFGEPAAFAQAQEAGWGHTVTPVWSSFIKDFNQLIHGERWVIWETAATALGLTSAFVAFKKLPLSYALYLLASIMLPLGGGTMKSMSRYLLVAFPVFILLAMATRRRFVYWAISAGFIILLAVATASFISGRWVA
ncbi:MAG: hypothetical protein M1309_05820 [Actinobacteria bacterium]|nr:hypothetical protein [Actinomycetota bacterium]